MRRKLFTLAAVVSAVLFVAVGMMLVLTTRFDLSKTGNPSEFVSFDGRLPVLCGFFAVSAAVLHFWPLARRTEEVRRTSLGLCPSCGYSLTGNVSGVCPECGTPTPKGVA